MGDVEVNQPRTITKLEKQSFKVHWWGFYSWCFGNEFE
jgi:hypothetical protein